MKLTKDHIGRTITKREFLNTYIVLNVTAKTVKLGWFPGLPWTIPNDDEFIIIKNKKRGK